MKTYKEFINEDATVTVNVAGYSTPLGSVYKRKPIITEDQQQFSSIQCTLPDTLSKEIDSFRKSVFEEQYLSENQYGSTQHITINCGLVDDNSSDVIKFIIEQLHSEQITATIKDISIFELETENVYVLSIESESLRNINKLITNNFKTESIFKKYNPHITLAYTKADFKADINNNPFYNKTFSIDTFQYCNSDDGEIEFRLNQIPVNIIYTANIRSKRRYTLQDLNGNDIKNQGYVIWFKTNTEAMRYANNNNMKVIAELEH